MLCIPSAGIKPKDMIIAIDGAETKDLTLYQAAEKLQVSAVGQCSREMCDGRTCCFIWYHRPNPACEIAWPQGDEGSNVELLVRPANSGMDRLVTLTRQQIRINPVSYAMCQPASAGLGSGAAGSKLGYIRLATFNSNTVEATKSALLDLKVRACDLRLFLLGDGLETACLAIQRWTATLQSFLVFRHQPQSLLPFQTP